MRVAINAWFWRQPGTGSGQYTRELVRALATLAPELDLRLVFPAAGGYRALTLAEAEVAPSPSPVSFVHAGGPGWGANLAKLRFEQQDFPRAAHDLRADLAHVPYWAPPLGSPVPLVVTVHDIIPLVLREYRGNLFVRGYTALVAGATRGARAVITDSQSSRNDIVARLGLPAGRVHAIPLAAGPVYQPGPGPDDDLRARYGLPDDYVLYLGSSEARKNVEALIGAYTWVASALQDQLPLVLGGRHHAPDGRLYPDLPAVARRHKLLRPEGETDCVRFIGPVDEADKPALYRGATAFAFLSRYEGFGLPPLEAMACGVPVVVSSASSLPEVVGGAGFVLDPDDTRHVAGALLALYNQPELAESMRERGLEQARQFSWARTARETLDVYRQTVKG
jgi:glycosyltransferase involved in cell wall biosynthesis